MKQENHDIVSIYYFLHREVLISISLGDELKKYLIMLHKWSTLSNKNQFTSECINDCVATRTIAHRSSAIYENQVAD